MKTAVTFAILGALCVLGQDLRTSIEKDLQQVLDSISDTETNGQNLIKSSGHMKILRHETCWKMAIEQLMMSVLPGNNDLTQIYNEMTDVETKLQQKPTDVDINKFMHDVLDGDQSYITRILATGNTMMSNANTKIKGLNVNC